MRTELADGISDDQGTMRELTFDDGSTIPLSNAISGLHANGIYRRLYEFTVDNGIATFYNATTVVVLHDSTEVAKHDPVEVTSVWLTDRYLNMHLRAKTKGEASHYFGYSIDRRETNHIYITLHHRQNNDPAAYTADVYASLRLSEIEEDNITITIKTFKDEYSSTHIRRR